MKNYEHYQVDDFFQDIYFRKWVLDTLPPADQFWKTWYATHPEQHEAMEEAKALILAFQCDDLPIDSAEVARSVNAILSVTASKKVMPLHRRTWVQAVATILLVLGIAVWISLTFLDSPVQYSTGSQSSEVADTRSGVGTPENLASQIQEITLHDGSKITLKANSTLRVAESSGQENREVYLTGAATFDVAKDAQKPFLVYTENVVIRVLGTSFEIRDYQQEKDVSVSVKTGKVTVFKNQVASVKTHSEDIILTPNQQAVYIKADHKLIKTIVENPVKLREPTKFRNFDYNEAPIPQVLTELEEAYGVKIIFDEQQLEHCNLTAKLTNEPLFEKLTLICETIQARYEVIDGQIVVNSLGCH